MRIGIVAVAGLIAAGAQAQTGKVGATTQASRYVIEGPGCPGALRAQHQPTMGKTIWTVALEDKNKKDQGRAPASMGLHVVFESARTQPRSAELSVSYLPLRLKAMPIESDKAQELKKTFALAAEDKDRLDGDLMVGPAATITRVHLMSVTFADGSVWHAPSEDACSVAPALYMPVEAKK